MNIPTKLGYPVSYRVFSWAEMAIVAWGEEWGKNDIAYEFPGGVKKESTDRYTTGIYAKTIPG